MLLPSTANDNTKLLVSPVLTEFQEAPLLVDKKTPPFVPAKILLPAPTANDVTAVFDSPVFTAFHDTPLLVERKTPLP
jgi:hypothetical protein